MKKNRLLKFILILSICLLNESLFAQQVISGVVTDATQGPMVGVNVVVEGTTLGTTTDIDGKYSLEASKIATLVFSFIGYESQSISVGEKTTINVSLKEGSVLDEVIVVGYGTQKKINVTGSVASIKTENVIRAPVTNVKSMLIGQTSGIITNQNPGLPGQDNVNLSIRGFGNPLVIVDGVESFLDRIDPNDIENISVLKDGAAAIYGVRGGDGVILITTKRGKSGKTQIGYHGFIGNQTPVKFLQPVSAADFIQAKRNGIFNVQYDPANPGKEIPYGEWTQESLDQYSSGQLNSYDWVDAMLKSNGGKIISNNISASGGSENVRFYSSIGQLTQNGIFNGDFKYDKLTFTNNLDTKLTNTLNFSLTTSFINEKRDYPAADIGTAWNDLRTSQPFFNPNLPDSDKAPYSGFTERSPVARTQQKFAGFDLTNLQTLAAAGELK
jgi:TonB-linked SusC/RagA family outer membrane protein